MANVIEIVSKYLKDNGFDGLYNEDYQCGCLIEDFMPCEGGVFYCIPGIKKPIEHNVSDSDIDFYVGPKE